MWTKTTLGELCKMYQPKTISAKQMKADGEFLVYGANGVIGRYDKYNHEEPQLLVTCRGATCGAVNVSTPKVWINGNAMVIQPNLEQVGLRYMQYLFRGGIDLSKAITGAAQPQITRQSLIPIEISYPPLAEQQRIVAKLDAAFAEIDKTIESTEHKAEGISSLHENAITAEFKNIKRYTEKKLSDVCEKITDGTHQTPKYFDSGYIFLSSKNVTSRKIDWDNVRYIDEAQHIQMHKRIAPKIGDVLLAKNGTTGVAAIVDRDVVFDIYVSLAWLRSKGEVLPEYLLEYVNSKMAREQFNKRTKGIGVPNLHLQEIREVVIRFPTDEEEQKSVVRKLKDIDDACDVFRQINKKKLQTLMSLKSAILAQELQSEAA
jgi:type I restriction enzyme, S subunit